MVTGLQHLLVDRLQGVMAVDVSYESYPSILMNKDTWSCLKTMAVQLSLHNPRSRRPSIPIWVMRRDKDLLPNRSQESTGETFLPK